MADFWHWFAGFVDGEGSFIIGAPSMNTPRCAFRVKLRVDDRDILDEIAAMLGHGRVVEVSNGRWNRQAVFQVQSKAGCAALVEIFDTHPLRAKKCRDYANWRLAVLAWAEVHPRPTPRQRARNQALQAVMASCRRKLISGRVYEEGVR